MTTPGEEDLTPARTRDSQISLKALEYLTKHPGSVVFVDDIADTTGFTQKQIVNAIGYLRNKSEVVKTEVKVIVHGKAWQYLPTMQATSAPPPPTLPAPDPVQLAPAQPTITMPPPPSLPRPRPVSRSRTARSDYNGDGELFLKIGVTGDGELLIKDEKGVVYVARKLTTGA